MFNNKFRSLAVAAGLVTTLAMTMGTSGVAFAAATNSPGASNNTAATLGVTGGSLTILSPATLAFAATLNGTAQASVTNAAGSFNLDVVDGRGTGAGWHVQLGATQFSNTGGTNKLANVGTLSVTNVAETMTDSTGTSTAPTIDPGVVITGSNAAAVAIDTTSATPATIYNTAAGSGMGSFTLNSTLNLNLPSNTKADTYTSTITVAAVTAIA